VKFPGATRPLATREDVQNDLQKCLESLTDLRGWERDCPTKGTAEAVPFVHQQHTKLVVIPTVPIYKSNLHFLRLGSLERNQQATSPKNKWIR
jgi:hypothetical protein